MGPGRDGAISDSTSTMSERVALVGAACARFGHRDGGGGRVGRAQLFPAVPVASSVSPQTWRGALMYSLSAVRLWRVLFALALVTAGLLLSRDARARVTPAPA